MKKSKIEAVSCSSPLATVEEIQKRLLRPRDSQPLSSFNSSQNHRCNAMSQSFYEIRKVREKELKREPVTNRRLEDYLDPELLGAVRAKIGSQNRKIGGEAKFTRRSTSLEFDEFDRTSGSYNELKRAKIEKNGAADLKSHSDSIGDSEFLCGHFSQFERTALKRFVR